MKKEKVIEMLDKKVEELKKLLKIFPNMETPDDFDNEMEKRRVLWREIHADVEKLGDDMEHVWAAEAWKNVKRKKMVVEPDNVVKGKKKWV